MKLIEASQRSRLAWLCGQVCDFVLICDETRLVTGAMDNELRMWDVVIDNKVL